MTPGELTSAASTLPDKLFYRRYKSEIPKGIYYEAAKKRWRVRLYKSGSVIFLGYFKSFHSSIAAYQEAKEVQRNATSKKLEELDLKTTNTEELITTLSII